MEIKVRALDGLQEKSSQEIEKEVLAAAEAKENAKAEVNTTGVDDGDKGATTEKEQEGVQPEAKTEAELKEEDVLSFIKSKYSKDITSIDELFNTGEAAELPEEIQGYLEYKEKTKGRGLADYMKLSEDISSMDEDQILSEYFISTGDAIDSEDVEVLMEDFVYDEDFDEEKDIKKKKLAKKQTIVKAKKFLETQREMHKHPLESSTGAVSAEQQEELKAYNEYIAEAKTTQEVVKRQSDWFLEKTDEVFSDFKGFDFQIDDSTLTFNPGDAAKLKETQLDSTNFMKKFIDPQTGLVKDARGYHKALAVAMNPDKFAKFFYEQGKSEGTEGVVKGIKNVDMTTQRVPEVSKNKDGFQVRAITPPSGRGLTIK